MATASTSWMPAQGKFQVNIGSSLNRALKARKQGGTPPATNPRRNLPDRDFYSFRYNFKPPSIDSTKPGTVEIKKGREKEKSQVALELSSQAGEANIYAGNETQAKEWDCVLVYDDETGAYTLEKVDSFVSLTFERKRTTARTHSPIAAASPTDRDAEGEDDDDLEKELLGLTEDIPLAEQVQLAKAKQQKRSQPPSRPVPQKKEQEKRIPPISETKPALKAQSTKPARQTNVQPKPRATATAPAPTPAPIPTPAPTPALTPAPNMGQPPPPTSAPLPTPASKPKATTQTKKRKEPELAAQSDPEVEVLSFGLPTKRAKVETTSSAPTPPSAPSEGFALPGTSNSGFFQPPPPPKGHKPSMLAVQPTTAVAEDSDKEDWEEVTNAGTDLEPEPEPVPRALSYHSDEGDVGGDTYGDGDGDGDDGNGDDGGLFGDDDVDMEDELAKQLNEELDGDFLEAAMTEAPPSNVQPLSWDQLAAQQGVTADYDSDEYSSSEDSDDD